MAIIICKNCGGKVSTTRSNCPHCGFAIPKTKVCPECEAEIDESLNECPVCGYLFVEEQVDTRNLIPKEINEEAEENNIQFDGRVADGIAILERKFTKEEFLKHALIELSKNKAIPQSIFEAEFKDIKELSTDVYVVKGDVKGSFTVTVGYDRKETYTELKFGHIGKGVPYTHNGYPKMGTGEKVYYDVQKTRTVTDWSPFSGNYGPQEHITDFCETGEQLEAILSAYLRKKTAYWTKNTEFDFEESNEGIGLTDADLKRARGSLVLEGKIDTKFPGDRHKDASYSYSASINEIYVVRFPIYEITIVYQGQEYILKGLANEKYDIYVDNIEHEEETIETIDEQRVSESIEKNNPYEIGLKIGNVLLIISIVLIVVSLGLSSFSLIAFLIVLIAGAGLLIASILTKLILKQIIRRNDKKIDAKYAKIKKMYQFRKILALEKGLDSNGLSQLTKEEIIYIDPDYLDIDKDDLVSIDTCNEYDTKKETDKPHKEKTKCTKRSILLLVLSCLNFLFLLAPFIMFFAGDFLYGEATDINYLGTSGFDLAFVGSEGFLSPAALIMSITNAIALVISLLIPIFYIAKKKTNILIIIESVVVLITVGATALIPFTIFDEYGEYFSSSCFRVYTSATYILHIIFLPISLFLTLSLLFLCTYTSNKKKPFKMVAYINSGVNLILTGLVALSVCFIYAKLESSNLSYQTINNKTEARILGGRVRLTNIEIPETINGLPVTEVGAFAFDYDSNHGQIKSVSFPSTIKSIGWYAFAYQRSLKAIHLPFSLTCIEGYAFCGCNNIPYVSLPKYLESIEKGAFYNCDSLSYVCIPSSVLYIDDHAFGIYSNEEDRNLNIYCEAPFKPSTWSNNWIGDSEAKVFWAGEWEYGDDGVPHPINN